MMITNFYTRPENINDETLVIDGEEARHILSVVRYKIGDVISVVDGRGTRYRVLIQKATPDFLQGRIISEVSTENEPAHDIALAQAVCRQERMDFLIEKATEIGVSSIIPVLTERSLVKIGGPTKQKAKTDRWRRLTIASMKQSLRTVLPKVHDIIKFDELLSQMEDFDLCLIASLEKDSKSIKECESLKRELWKILLIVGPEAGFTEEELLKAKAHGAIPITLGTRRLRTETAGIVFLSLVLHQLNDLS